MSHTFKFICVNRQAPATTTKVKFFVGTIIEMMETVNTINAKADDNIFNYIVIDVSIIGD